MVFDICPSRPRSIPSTAMTAEQPLFERVAAGAFEDYAVIGVSNGKGHPRWIEFIEKLGWGSTPAVVVKVASVFARLSHDNSPALNFLNASCAARITFSFAFP